MHSRAGRPERCLNKSDRALGRDAATRSAKLWSDRIATEKPDSLWTGAALVVVPAARSSSQGRGGSRSLLRVRPMEEGRKSSLSYRPAALPKPFVPSGCASIGIIAAPLSESLFVKRWL
jgi:hypothetical protein